MGPEECGTFDVKSMICDITRVVEATDIVGRVGAEVTDVTRAWGEKGPVVEAVSCDQIELMGGSSEDIRSLNA